ncbi:hypothetical protein OH77DRAFT_1427607 [Trametes cingulata]|nr:hypothetical protein OH77DRAFT_1427607 [Trametes cingulata]
MESEPSSQPVERDALPVTSNHPSTPIHQLPPKILLAIFEYCRPLARTKPLRTTRTPSADIRPLITISHVCSSWRNLVLNQRTLWSYVDGRNERLCEAFLQRSQGIQISLRITTKLAERLQNILTAHGRRIWRLDLEVHSAASAASALPERLRESCPHLICLTVLNDFLPTDTHVNRPSGTREGLTQPPPLLKALALASVLVSVPTIRFPHLTHLYLDKLSVSDVTKQGTGSHLTRFLSNCPLLEHLHLRGLPRAHTTALASQPARLNRMRSLTCVHSDMQAAIDLVASLEFPTTTMVRLDHVTCSIPSDVRFNATLASREFLQSLTRLHVGDAFKGFHLIAEGPSSGLYIHATYENDTEQGWTDWLSDMLAVHSFPALTELHVSPSGGAEFVTAANLRKMPLLAEIRVLPDRAWGMQLSEGLLDRLYRSLASEPICCSRLEALHFSVSRSDLPEHLLPEDLIPMVAARAHRGCPLRRIQLSAYDDGPECATPRWEAYMRALAPLRQLDLAVHIYNQHKAFPGAYRDGQRTDIWRTDGAEDFWELPADEQMRYTFA